MLKVDIQIYLPILDSRRVMFKIIENGTYDQSQEDCYNDLSQKKKKGEEEFQLKVKTTDYVLL